MYVWQRNIVTETGDVIPNAVMDVFLAGTTTRASIFSDQDGLVPITNPFSADVNGFAQFYVDSGLYDIATTSGGGALWADVQIGFYTVAEIDALSGAANGLATLDSTGLVPSSQLPSYVDDVLEYADFASLPVIGETSKIYVTLDDNHQYRWSGATYIDITTDTVAVANRRKQYAKETLARDVVVGDVSAGKATIILTAAENLYGRIVISDTTPLTSVAGELLISSDVRDLIVVNNDNVDLKVWRDNGAGVGVGGFINVLAGEWAKLYCDGTNIIDNGTPFSINQKIYDATSVRAISVPEVNNSGRTIRLIVSDMNSSATTVRIVLKLNGVRTEANMKEGTTAGSYLSASLIIKNGDTYELDALSTGTFTWRELRNDTPA